LPPGQGGQRGQHGQTHRVARGAIDGPPTLQQQGRVKEIPNAEERIRATVGQRYYFILTSLSKDTPAVESRPSPELSRVAVQASVVPSPAAVPAPPK